MPVAATAPPALPTAAAAVPATPPAATIGAAKPAPTVPDASADAPTDAHAGAATLEPTKAHNPLTTRVYVDNQTGPALQSLAMVRGLLAGAQQEQAAADPKILAGLLLDASTNLASAADGVQTTADNLTADNGYPLAVTHPLAFANAFAGHAQGSAHQLASDAARIALGRPVEGNPLTSTSYIVGMIEPNLEQAHAGLLALLAATPPKGEAVPADAAKQPEAAPKPDPTPAPDAAPKPDAPAPTPAAAA